MVAVVHAYVIRGGAHAYPPGVARPALHSRSQRPGGARDSSPALVATDASPRCTLAICAHESTLLTNPEPCILVEERIFYALQVRTRTI